MRLPRIAVPIAALSLIACNGPKTTASGMGPENTLIETSEYTGIIISESGASEFGYLFSEAPTDFWEPSTDDISRAEKRIRGFLVSVQDSPTSGSYQKEDAALILENLGKYRRQYVGIVVDGEKRIWCNAFYSDVSSPNWRRLPVDVDGGGKNFWQIECVLLRDECVNFTVHGVARTSAGPAALVDRNHRGFAPLKLSMAGEQEGW